MGRLTELIVDTDMYDNKLVELWINIKDVLLNNYIIGEENVSITLATKYQYDMYGLYKELGYDDVSIMPHIIVNGYKSSREYDGKKLILKKIDPNILSRYYNSYLKNK